MAKQAAFPLHHTIVVTSVPGVVEEKMKVVITDEGTFLPLIDYFRDREMSQSGQAQLAQVTGLFIDYVKQVGHEYLTKDTRALLFYDFAKCLYCGTIKADGTDPTGLYWCPRRRNQAEMLLNAFCQFSDRLHETTGARRMAEMQEANFREQIAFWRKWNTQKASSLLSHTMSKSEAKEAANTVRRLPLPQASTGQKGRPPYFPDQYLLDLLFKGFVRPGHQNDQLPWNKFNIRDVMITILLNCGGLRESEAFHLYVDDVKEDPTKPGSAIVRVYHPTEGVITYLNPITKKREKTIRANYLRSQYGREARNQLPQGRQHAGWKNPLLTESNTENFIHVHWFPTWAGEVFWQLYQIYIKHARPKGVLSHPYLFVSEKSNVAGLPYTIPSYIDAHAAAVERIGLTPSKRLGTTPHGHRHAYAQRLEDLKIPSKDLQTCLHHKSILSQLPYTEREIGAVTDTLRQFELGVLNGSNDSQAAIDLLKSGIFDVDELQLFSGAQMLRGY